MKLITGIFLLFSLNANAQVELFLKTNLTGEYQIGLNDRYVEFVILDSAKIYKFDHISDLPTAENISLDSAGLVRISINEDYPIFEIDLRQITNGDTVNLSMEKFYRVDTLTVSSNCTGIKSEKKILVINQDEKNYKNIHSIPVRINSNDSNFQVLHENEVKITTGNCKGKTGFHKTVITSQIIITNKKSS